MKRIQFTQPFDYEKSPFSGWTRKHWEEAFFVLMKGIVDNASEGGARQRIPGQRSHHGRLADELEGFTRSGFMAGPWLYRSNTGKYTIGDEEVDVAGFYRKGILAGTNPNHPEYWGDVVDYAQHLVECAALSWFLYLSRKHVWDQFSDSEKKQVAEYLYQCTQVKYHHNNWLLFNVITNTVLKKLGMPYSQEQIDENLSACDHMYIGEGWYRDGNINRIDYYNAWGFHFYYLLWVLLDGESKPEIAEMHKQRVREFVRNFRYFFGADGGTPCFGRSMIYRFGYLSPIALGQYLGALDVPPGEVKTMVNLGAKFFLEKEIITDNGFLGMGYMRPCEAMLEHYSCGGSPYWAAKAFSILLIPEDDPFWSVPEEPLPIHRKSYSIPIRSAGLLLIGDHKTGHVQLINHKSYHDHEEYNAKYTNFAYSSIFSYEARAVYGSFNCDNSLQFSEDGIFFKQRWNMDTLFVEKDFIASTYPLHGVDEEGRATTYTLVKDDFMVNFHQVATKKSLIFREGGYPLGFDEGEPTVTSVPGGELAYKDGKLTFLRNLYGYQRQVQATPYYEVLGGTNVRYRHSVVPRLEYENKGKHLFYLASMVYGKVGSDSIQQLMSLVTEFKVEGNIATVRFYDGEAALMQIGEVNGIQVRLNGVSFSGPIVLARVDASGKDRFVLYRNGKVETNWEKYMRS